MADLASALATGPVVLDGGLATHLEARGHVLSTHLWSAELVRQEPDEIVAVHDDYFAAGALVATTASYQASFEGLARVGLTRHEAVDLLVATVRLADRSRRRAVEVARAAGDRRARWVAASVGPYGAALADGSEYRGDYGLSVGDLARWHRPRLQVLAEAGADVLALETIPCLAEVEALLSEVDGTGMPCWLSLTADGARTRRGEPLDEAFTMAADVAEVIAVGVNCCSPSDVAGGVALAVEHAGLPAVAYPNSGEAWDAATHRWHGGDAFDPATVGEWVAAGARLVGGCCRVGPDAIAHVATHLSAHPN